MKNYDYIHINNNDNHPDNIAIIYYRSFHGRNLVFKMLSIIMSCIMSRLFPLVIFIQTYFADTY